MVLIPIFEAVTFFILLGFSAFFASAETAYTAVNRVKIRNLAKSDPKKLALLESVYRNPKKFITGILVGNNIAHVSTSALATAILLNILHNLGIYSLAAAMPIITFIVTTVLVIFGDILPKTFAFKQPERLALIYAKPIGTILFLLYPIILLFEGSVAVAQRVLGISNTEADRQKLVSIEEIKAMLDMSREDGVLEKEKKEMITSIFEFSDTVVREIMTPRTDTVCIGVDKTVQDAIQLILEKGHSRIPVYEERIDNILGIVYAKDLLGIPKNNQTESLRKYLRDAVFIPESKNVEELLQQMKRAKFHLAIIVDEYGGMAGIVTLEDIIEEIIGDIQDEYEAEEEIEFREISEGRYLVDASLNITDLGEKLGLDIPENEDYDTIGGLVLSLLGRVPAKGEEIDYLDWGIRVRDVRKRRILTLEIYRKTPVKTTHSPDL